MLKKQKLFVTTLVVLGSLVALVSAIYLLKSFCRLRYAENLILRKKPRNGSSWEVIETRRSHLFRVRNGKFRGWYLAADDLVNARDISPAPGFTTFPGRRLTGPQVRNLILRDKLGKDCYFKVTDTPNGVRIQAAGGRYESWYLHLLPGYTPDIGIEPPTAWNLVLIERDPAVEAVWKLTRTATGHLIQATAPPFEGWYVDALPEANILERNLCWGKEATRDGPEPPLAR
jgi:hypothetical protein